MRKILGNAFSINMLQVEDFTLVRFKKIRKEDVPKDVTSAIGHPDTARVVGNLLGFEVACERATVSLSDDDILYVAQYKGPRLTEGVTTLPEGATLEFYQVTIRNNGCARCGSLSTGAVGECDFCKQQDWLAGGGIL